MRHPELLNRNKEICKMIAEGKPVKETALHFGLSEGTIRWIFSATAGGSLPDKNSERNKKIFDEVLSGKTFEQIGEEHGLTRERIRQIYRKSGGTKLFYREKHKARTFNRGLMIAEEFMKNKKYFPLQKELLNYLISKHASSCVTEIHKALRKKYEKLPSCETLKHKAKTKKLLKDLKQLYKKVKMPLSQNYHLKKYGLMTATSYKHYFGTFRNACKIAGVPCGKRGGDAKRVSWIIKESIRQ